MPMPTAADSHVLRTACETLTWMSASPIRMTLDRWFAETIGTPTSIQVAAWPVLRTGRDAMLVAATGQGKSLAAWRPLVERLVHYQPRCRGVRGLHIAPLKALARDMTRNLAPLLEAAVPSAGRPLNIALRCGDTTRGERERQRRDPPDILSTTPESLYVLLGSRAGREMLAPVEGVVVDELHALVGSKRGAHLTLSLSRLDALTGRPAQRIGLSATACPDDELAAYLTGGRPAAVIAPDKPGSVCLELELGGPALGPYPTACLWEWIHERIAELAQARGSLLVFCQTRARVERTAAALDERLAAAGLVGQVGVHHGSLDAGHRETVEGRFKAGQLRVLVSSASLELGLDLGRVDRVCQIGVPGSVNLVRQRAGRSGHRPGRRPCMHLFPLTLNQLVETRALADLLEDRQVETVPMPNAPLDVLAQHLVAMIASGTDRVSSLHPVVRAAWPYRGLPGRMLDQLLGILAARLDWMPEPQHKPLIRRRSDGGWAAESGAARLALVNAGTIPEYFEYAVVRADSGDRVGRLDEELCFESVPGQVIQLGYRPWRILRIETGRVVVEPADQEPAGLPFWLGEGQGRTPEVALAMQTLPGCPRKLHPQARQMLAESHALLGALPSPDRLIIERVIDPGGDGHVMLHTFAGARINRAWGLALRKRFCRQFNFELQAAATDDGVLISLGVTSRFELAEVAGFVRSHHVVDVLTQALLDTPLFVTRFRWCANNALVLLRHDLNGPLPAQRQRNQAENLIACVFPDQLACLENLSGPRQVPDHPLVQQALADCLNDYMDVTGLQHLLRRIETGDLRIHAVDTPRPSPLAEALIHAPGGSYLDEADAELRRTRSFERPASSATIGWSVAGGSPTARDQSVLPPPDACRLAVRQPSCTALEALLVEAGYLTCREGESGVGLRSPVPGGGWTHWFSRLLREGRAVTVTSRLNAQRLWVASRRLDWLRTLDPGLRPCPAPTNLPGDPIPVRHADIRAWLLAGRSQIDGDQATESMAAGLCPPPETGVRDSRRRQYSG